MQKQNKRICQHSDIVGKVELGEGCFIHPKAKINAEGGDIIIGKFNIVEERVDIHNKPVYDQNNKIIPKQMIIGDYNLFEIGTIIQSQNIGNCNHFEQMVYADQNCEIGNNSRFGPKCKIFGSKLISLININKNKEIKISDYSKIQFPSLSSTYQFFDIDSHKQFLTMLYQTLSNQEDNYSNQSRQQTEQKKK